MGFLGDTFSLGTSLLGDDAGGFGGLFDGGDGGLGDLASGLLGGGNGGGLSGLLGGSNGGGLGGLLGGSNGGGLGGVIDSFAGSSGLDGMIGGFMGGAEDGGIGGIIGNVVGNDGIGGAVEGLLGESGLASGVSDVLGGAGNNWLGGLTESLGSSGLGSAVSSATGGNFGAIESLAESAGQVVSSGTWFRQLDSVLGDAGDAFGSPGGIVATVSETLGGGNNLLDNISETANQIGASDWSLSGVADAVAGGGLGDLIPDGLPIGDGWALGEGLGELGDWQDLASSGLQALGVDLPEIDTDSSVLESLMPESTFAAGNEAAEGLLAAVEEPIAGVDDILGDMADLDAVAAVTSGVDQTAVPQATGPEPVSGFAEPNVSQFDADETDFVTTDAPLGQDAPPAFEEVADEVPTMNEFEETLHAADEIETSVDDLFEGLE